jgi:hypothetical protein
MVPKRILSRKNLARFAMTMRERLHVEDARLRKGYVRCFVERIEVDDATITVRGLKAVLASGFLAPAETGARSARLCTEMVVRPGLEPPDRMTATGESLPRRLAVVNGRRGLMNGH